LSLHEYPTLFSPITIGTRTLPNRIVAAPIDSKMGTSEGEITQRHVTFAVERARGGVGLIILDNMAVEWPRGKSGGTPIRMDDDRFMVALSDLVEAVRTWGAATFCQINHSGRQTNLRATQGAPLLSASAVPWPGSGTTPVEASRKDIDSLVQAYAQAALRVRNAGADGVEIHACHGYLLSSFLSPYTNRRTDENGGPVEARAKVVLDVLAAVRREVGDEFPVIVRINGRDYVEGGLELDDAMTIAKLLEAGGADAIDVTAGFYESRATTFPGVASAQAVHAELSAAVKQAVSIPVITVGKIRDPEAAETVLREGQADLVALARGLIADPQWAAKARRGEADTIRPCLYTNRCRFRIQLGLRMRCDVNPDVGERAPANRMPLRAGTKVLVIGGGPAGIEAALRLAEREAVVTLVERADAVGGQLRDAARVGFKRDLADYLAFLDRSLERSRVEVLLGQDASLESVSALAPDHIVVATGSTPLAGEGLAGSRVVSAVEALRGADLGETLVVVGAGPTGCEAAAELAARGHAVTLVEQKAAIGGDITIDLLAHLQDLYAEHSVNVLTDCHAERLDGDSLVTSGGGVDALRVDSVVLAVGVRSDTALADVLNDGAIPVYRIGDARRVGTILTATGDAARVVAAIEPHFTALQRSQEHLIEHA
jgi:2,4-dienoyl-CoA reductase-like NADH-dependent reductase (Old Yellow Enzyme family)/thioredoxin reductase